MQSQTASSYALHSLQAELKNAKYELEVQRRAKEAAEKASRPPSSSLLHVPPLTDARTIVFPPDCSSAVPTATSEAVFPVLLVAGLV